MEVIKRTIKRVMKTGVTVPCSYRDPKTGMLITGCTAVTNTIVPDTSISYYVKFHLSHDSEDIGFFNAYDFPGVIGETVIPTQITITGKSTTRLTELRKYVISGTIAEMYKTGGSVSVDGVDLAQTNVNKIVYFIGGIKYTDTFSGYSSGTTFSFVGQGLSGPDFINKPIYKDPNKENIISNPKIYDDVFIVRQEIPAFDKNYRLEYISNLVDLETYAGGKFFNIVKNT